MATARPTAKRSTSNSTTKNHTGIWSPPDSCIPGSGPGRNGEVPREELLRVPPDYHRGMIEATLYSDAACPWAYSANPALRVLEWRYGAQLSWRLVMIGLREDASTLIARGYDP